jgi:hypothetical protein
LVFKILLGYEEAFWFFLTYLIQAMTEAAIFTIGRSRIVGYGKIPPLVDYRTPKPKPIVEF